MPFIVLLIASLICAVLALQLHLWQLGLLAVVFSFPIALVAQVNYGGLLLLPYILLAMTVALRWGVGPVRWLSLILTAAIVWFVGAASPFLLHWPTALYWVLVLGVLSGLVALFWSHKPWMIAKARPRA